MRDHRLPKAIHMEHELPMSYSVKIHHNAFGRLSENVLVLTLTADYSD